MRMSGASFAGLFVLAGSLSSAVSFADEPAPMAPSPCPTRTETTPAHCILAWVVDALGIRQLPEGCLDSSAPASTAALAAPSTEEPCDPPTFVDARGIRRVRRECLGALPSPAPVGRAGAAPPADPRCDPPWRFDEKGIQRLKLECLSTGSDVSTAMANAASQPPPAATSPAPAAARPFEGNSCDPPWYVDARGIRRLRQNCL